MGTTSERIDGADIHSADQQDLTTYRADQETLQRTPAKKQVASIYRDGTGMPQ